MKGDNLKMIYGAISFAYALRQAAEISPKRAAGTDPEFPGGTGFLLYVLSLRPWAEAFIGLPFLRGAPRFLTFLKH